jgi:hypothetical protein
MARPVLAIHVFAASEAWTAGMKPGHDVLERFIRGAAPLPGAHKCGMRATVPQHLTLKAAGHRRRRFLATPLHEIIPRELEATDLEAMDAGYPGSPDQEMAGKRDFDGRQDP